MVTVVHMSEADFEAAVVDALDAVPDELARMVANVAVLVEDEPPPGRADLLGLYEGVPLTARDSWWAAGSLPDRITIYRGPLARMCQTEAELREQVLITVVHEIAHHFGIGEERLHELGWG
jgi:predicted Zn-dependent protease with MMP-like domain